MARFFPDPPVGFRSPDQVAFYEALRQVPGDDVLVWRAMPFSSDWHPNWMILDGDRSCYLLIVPVLGKESPSTDPQKLMEVIALLNRHLQDFVQSFLPGKNFPIYGAAVFPSLSQDILDGLTIRASHFALALWGREMIDPQAIRQILDATPSDEPLPPDIVTRLRKKLCPEIVIPAGLIAHPRESQRRKAAPALTSHVLNLNQEYLVKECLQLTEKSGCDLLQPQIRVITGIAGSGKSLVLLYRAALQERLRPAARVLAVTHNKPLAHELQFRMRKIHPESKIQWQTFHYFCGLFHGKQRELINPEAKTAFFEEKRTAFSLLQDLPTSFIIEEIDWIRDQGFDAPEEYLTAARPGRKRSLPPEQRANLLGLLESFCQFLNKTATIDWIGVAERTWWKLRRNRIEPPVFDFIYLDEAQFFPPLWLRILQRCLKPGQSRVTIAADPSQGFLRRQTSWQNAAFSDVCSEVNLRTSHRNSREILEFASHFYQSRLPDEEEEIHWPDAAEMENLPSGEAPHWIELKPSEDEARMAIYEILSALENGANPGDILLIAHGFSVPEMVEKLNRLAQATVAIDAKEVALSGDNFVRVTTLNAAAGLESATVYLLGLDAFLQNKAGPALEVFEQMELLRDRTRQTYMVLTRAIRRLFIFYRDPETRRILLGDSGGEIH